MTNTEQFKQIVSEMAETYTKKNADYGNSFDITLNKWGHKIALARIEDKLNRVSTLLDSEAQVKDESIEDTLKDLATYAVMFLIWLKNSEVKNNDKPVQPQEGNLAQKLFAKYGGQELLAMKGLNRSGYAPTLILGKGTVVSMHIKGDNLLVKFIHLHKGDKTVGSGTLDALYPVKDLDKYGLSL